MDMLGEGVDAAFESFDRAEYSDTRRGAEPITANGNADRAHADFPPTEVDRIAGCSSGLAFLQECDAVDSDTLGISANVVDGP